MNCNMQCRLLFCVITLFLFYGKSADGTLSKKGKKAKTKAKKNENVVVPNALQGPSEKSVFDRDLVVEKVKVNDILKYFQSYYSNTTKRLSNGDVLGYVTPWNSHGYDVGKIFGSKFSMISPVWLQIKKQSTGQFYMTGGHDIDKGWMNELKKVNNKLSIVPRVLFDGWSVSDFHTIFQSRERLYQLVDYMVGYLESEKFDGMVLEVMTQYSGHYKAELAGLVKELGEAMISKNLKLILVIPPPLFSENIMGLFTKDDFDVLAPIVDYFSLMTYDYPHRGRPGAVAPYDWVKQCIYALAPTDNVQRSKILMGLNFYGMDYKNGGAAPIVGKSYTDVLKKNNVKMDWIRNEREHRLTVKDHKTARHIYYPTLKSIYDRVTLANELGTGIAIWELGQGLDYFYDLL